MSDYGRRRVPMPVSRRWLAPFGGLALGAIVFFIYASSINVGFFADDYNFLEPAVRLSVSEYLVHYFDPRAQVLWYRPLQGVQMLAEYAAFGANAFGYHVVQLLIHWVNGVLVFALVRRVSPNTILALLSALFYISFPVYALAVNWINITDPVMATLYMLAVWFWLDYLDRVLLRAYVITLLLFIAALLFKQMALTLPIILVLLDLCFYRTDFKITRLDALTRAARDLAPRYLAFGLVALGFFGVQYFTQSTHTYAGVFGYSLGPHIFSILAQYLSLLCFPWGYFPPTDTQITDKFPDFISPASVVWMVLVLAFYLLAVIRTRSRALIFLGAAAFFTLVPVLPFPFIELRYLYLPAIFSGIGLALLAERARRILHQPVVYAVLVSIVVGLLILGDAAAVGNANAEIAEIARQRRVPFRDISSAHRTFPTDTFLYFVDPVSPLSELKGLFALRYGRGVTVGGNRQADSDNWRDHQNTLVYYFDDTGKPVEVAVEQIGMTQTSLPLPARFGGSIALERVDIAQTKIVRGGELIALLSWRATAPIDNDYSVFAHLADREGKTFASVDSPPNDTSPTHAWPAGARVVTAMVLRIPANAPVGDGYILQIGLYQVDVGIRLKIVDPTDTPMADRIEITPIAVLE